MPKLFIPSQETRQWVQSDIDRFWKYVKKTSNCLVWNGSVDGKGYGIFKKQIKLIRKGYRAHRIAYEIVVGKIPSNLFICHKCDNKKCVNPQHLFLGTQKDNLQDAHEKGRLIRSLNVRKKMSLAQQGERGSNAKLRETDILKIRKLYKTGIVTLQNLAEQFEVSFGTISKIINYRRWQHI